MDQVFIGDLAVKGALYAITVRSPVARGRLIGIDVPRMGVNYSFIQAKDIPGKNSLDLSDHPILAGETLSYRGEPVALLVGPERSRLESYLAQCTVQTEEYPAPGRGPETGEGENGKVEAGRVFSRGNVEEAFAAAEKIVEGFYRTGIQEHWYSDPHGALAYFSFDKLMVHTTTQWPFHVRASVAKMLNTKAPDIVVCPSLLGIHLDGKLWYPSLISCHAALAAFMCKKPVRLLLSRREDFLYSPKRHGTEIRIKSALGKKGEILGTAIDVASDVGAYGFLTDEILDHMCLGTVGAYTYTNLRLNAKAGRSATPPRGPFCGFGLSQGFFAVERHVSKIADVLNQDPAEWRKNYAITKNSALALDIPLKNSLDLDTILDSAVAMGDYNRKWAAYELLRKSRTKDGGEKLEPLRGIGVSLGYQTSGFIHPREGKEKYSVELTLDKEGKLEIKTSMSQAEQDSFPIWQHIAGEILSMDSGDVKVNIAATNEAPDTGPSCLSRNITITTKLVERCCYAIRKQRFRDPLPITVSRSYNAVRGQGLNGLPLDLNAFSHLSWAAAVVEVEIDPVELFPKVRGVWLSVDGGKILNEGIARNSMKFLVMQALGWASVEELEYKNNSILDEDSIWYTIPAAKNVPPIDVDFLWNDTSVAKGIAELPFNCVPAAYAQAVSQAADYSFDSIPLGPKQIWEARRKAGSGEKA